MAPRKHLVSALSGRTTPCSLRSLRKNQAASPPARAPELPPLPTSRSLRENRRLRLSQIHQPVFLTKNQWWFKRPPLRQTKRVKKLLGGDCGNARKTILVTSSTNGCPRPIATPHDPPATPHHPSRPSRNRTKATTPKGSQSCVTSSRLGSGVAPVRPVESPDHTCATWMDGREPEAPCTESSTKGAH